MTVDSGGFPKVLTLYLAISQYPILGPKIRERMRQELFQRGVITPEDFEAEAREKAVQSQIREGLGDSLGQEPTDSWRQRLGIIRDNLTDFYFAYNLPFEQFEKILKEVLSGRVPTEEVVLTIHPELAPWDMLFAQGEMYENSPPEKRESVAHHLKEIKVVLIKAMISDHLPYLAIAREWFDIADLKNIREHRIGRGKIGGKAAGVMLADTVLRKSADPELKPFLHVPPSWFLGADVFYQFSQVNGLLRFANQKYRTEEEIRTDYPAIESVFLDGQFPTEIVESLRSLLETVGSKPLIVRSSSLLEDSYGTSFAGKYESYFCANQGDPDQNLADLLNAVQ
ncbi:MAG: PEP/pyruvate-binding domain-containing protein, partial [Anaerolineales bacterium]